MSTTHSVIHSGTIYQAALFTLLGLEAGAYTVGSKRALGSVLVEHTVYQGRERWIKMIPQIGEYTVRSVE